MNPNPTVPRSPRTGTQPRIQRRRWVRTLSRCFDTLINVAGETGDFLWDEHPEARDRACATGHMLDAAYHTHMALEALADEAGQ